MFRNLHSAAFCIALATVMMPPAVSMPNEQIMQLRRNAEEAVVHQNYEAAQTYFKEALRVAAQQNDGGIQKAVALDDLATFYLFRDQSQQSASLLEEALAIRRKALWPEHPDIALNLLNLATAEYQSGNLVEAAHHYQEVFTNYRRVVARNAESVFVNCIDTGMRLAKNGNHALAEQLYRTCLDAAAVSETRQRPVLLIRLGNVLAAQGKRDEALKAYQTAIAYIERNQPWNDKRRQKTMARLRRRVAEFQNRNIHGALPGLDSDSDD